MQHAAALNTWFDRIDALPEPERTAMLAWAQQQLVRERSIAQHAHPAQLAASIDPDVVITPAIDLIGRELERAISTRRGRLLITMPPQEGKSQLTAIWAVVRALQVAPNWRIILASFSQALAEESSMAARNIIAAHGTGARDPLTGTASEDQLGIALASDKSAASHWRIRGHRGGLVAVGLGGTITGRPADLLIIDDPIKGMQAADSTALRTKIIEGFRGDLTTRLAPGAPVILIQTRWHEDDLAGWLLKEDAKRPPERREWRHVNIPAVAAKGVPDALGRQVGEWLVSARGRTPDDWAATRELVGPRVWSALYQGQPTPAGGGLFHQAWFDRHRQPELGETAVRIVSIDPAETGKRDEAGLVAAAATADGRILWTHDESGRMTSDVWSRRAVILALRTGATEIVFEAYTTEQTYGRVILQAWRTIRDRARLLQATGSADAAAIVLAADIDPPSDPIAAIAEVVGLPVPDQDDPPFTIHPHRGRGDKVARATGARQAAETGRLRIVGSLPVLERQATTWQVGQDSPDRMDAAVNAFNRLSELLGAETVIAVPTNTQTAEVSPMAALLGSPMHASDAV